MHNLFSSLKRSICFSFRFLLLSFYGPPERQNPRVSKFFIFLLINTFSGLLADIGWPVCTSKSFYATRSLNYYTSSELLTSGQADDFSPESKWQRVSSGLQDYSQYFGFCSQLTLRFLIHQSLLSSLCESFQVRQLQLVSLSPSWSTAFLVLRQGPSTCLSFRFLWFFTLWSTGTADSLSLSIYIYIYIYIYISYFCYLSLGLVFWLGLGDPFVSQNPWELYASHSPRWILICTFFAQLTVDYFY